jgi:hypothetical protein
MEENTTNSANLPPDTIDKRTADLYVQNWKSGAYTLVPSTVESGSNNILRLDSFEFSIDDFTLFAERVNVYNANNPNNKITGAVCRLGIKPNPIAGGVPPNVPALFFEPVVGFNKSPLTAGTIKGDLPTSVPGVNASARYDFSYPCPPTCPSAS